MTSNIHKSLNIIIANLNVLTHKELHVHLFAKGPSFFAIHNETRRDLKFAFEKVDDFQERLLSINGTPVCSFKEYLELATIKENFVPDLSVPILIEELIADFKHIRSQLLELAALAEENNDFVTADLCIPLIGYFEERTWQYSSFIA